MSTAHTALPWTTNVTKTDGAITHWHITGAKHGSVYPICNHTIEQEPTGAEQLENAAFIVRACNAHDDLVKALGQIAKLYEDRANATTIELAGLMYDSRCIARAALTKAAGAA